jgi:hypothetical protein
MLTQLCVGLSERCEFSTKRVARALNCFAAWMATAGNRVPANALQSDVNASIVSEVTGLARRSSRRYPRNYCCQVRRPNCPEQSLNRAIELGVRTVYTLPGFDQPAKTRAERVKIRPTHRGLRVHRTRFEIAIRDKLWAPTGRQPNVVENYEGGIFAERKAEVGPSWTTPRRSHEEPRSRFADRPNSCQHDAN